jgi:hypothetical protein
MRSTIRIVRRVTLAIVGVGVFVAASVLLFPGLRFIVGMGIIGRADPAWPPITDSDGLVSDCASLVRQVVNGQEGNGRSRSGVAALPPQSWPIRIRELHPIRVTVDQGVCRLLFHNQFQNLSLGYTVDPTAGDGVPHTCARPENCGDRSVWPTNDDRIVRWEGAQ